MFLPSIIRSLSKEPGLPHLTDSFRLTIFHLPFFLNWLVTPFILSHLFMAVSTAL